MSSRRRDPQEKVLADHRIQDTLQLELKALSITIYEVALYRDSNTASLPSTQPAKLWSLLTSARDCLTFALSVPSEVVPDLPMSFFNLLQYALVVLSNVVFLPSAPGWDSSIAKREANALDFGLRIKAKFGDDLTKTGPDPSMDERDVWQYFSRGISALIAWHQMCESSPAAVGHSEFLISSPGMMLKCGMSDTMTALSSWKACRSGPPNAANRAREGTIPNSAESSNREGPEGPSDAVSNAWDDEAWQSMLDDFSMFPTTAGFPVG